MTPLLFFACIVRLSSKGCKGKHEPSACVISVIFISILAECKFRYERDVSDGFLYLSGYFIYPVAYTGPSAATVYQMYPRYRP